MTSASRSKSSSRWLAARSASLEACTDSGALAAIVSASVSATGSRSSAVVISSRKPAASRSFTDMGKPV
ncbi:hypothetical protein D3C80_2120960 [compost metagenome]